MVRTRMSGGVEGKARESLPIPIQQKVDHYFCSKITLLVYIFPVGWENTHAFKHYSVLQGFAKLLP
jgi:hypothetical protein